MNTSFEKSKNSTDEWYTPKEIIDALGEFDLDPCAPMRPLWRTARVMYNKEQDGLKQKWEGRVWLNPPYSRPTIEHLNLMAHYMDELNKAFAYVSASPLSSTWYRSSTESSPSVAWYVDFSIGSAYYSDKYNSSRVRAVIDF